MVALLVVLTILVFLTADYFLQRAHRVHALGADGSAASEEERRPVGFFGRPGYRVPQGVFFDAGHTWLHLEESGVAKVGINDFAQAVVGDVDEIITRAPGEQVRKGDTIIELRHGERAVAFRSPVDGVVREINEEMLDREEILSVEPQSAAWICRIRPDDPGAVLGGMMIGATAKDWLEREVARVKVFLSTIAPEHPVLGHTMQDGGLPGYGLIDFLDDVEWKKLHEKFFS
jgi:glycine cleavage system H protein